MAMMMMVRKKCIEFRFAHVHQNIAYESVRSCEYFFHVHQKPILFSSNVTKRHFMLWLVMYWKKQYFSTCSWKKISMSARQTTTMMAVVSRSKKITIIITQSARHDLFQSIEIACCSPWWSCAINSLWAFSLTHLHVVVVVGSVFLSTQLLCSYVCPLIKFFSLSFFRWSCMWGCN